MVVQYDVMHDGMQVAHDMQPVSQSLRFTEVEREGLLHVVSAVVFSGFGGGAWAVCVPWAWS